MSEQFPNQPLPSPKLDLLRTKEGLDHDRKKRFSAIFKIAAIAIFFVVIFISFFSYRVMSVSNNVLQSKKHGGVFTQLKKFILSDNKQVKGEDDGRTNILILGAGGEGHEGSLLTDTVMLVSVKFKKDDSEKNRIAMISIPRDLVVPYNQTQVKINSIYAQEMARSFWDSSIAEENTANAISKVLGVAIHYYIRADFDGFKKIVDSLNGINVEVKNSFYDPEYPTDDFGYQVVSFKKGLQHMNGETALQYSRSRHGIVTEGDGNEASDFARAMRQQQVLEVIKNKALSLNTILNPKKVSDLLGVTEDRVRTNLDITSILRFYDVARNTPQEEIIKKVIDNQDNGLLYAASSILGYSLLPKNNDYAEIQKFTQNIFTNTSQEDLQAKIIILNGTEIPGLAQGFTQKLESQNYDIVSVNNAPKQDYEKSVVYRKAKHSYPNFIKYLQNSFQMNIASSTPKGISEFSEVTSHEWDIIIVLGQNYGEPKLENQQNVR